MKKYFEIYFQFLGLKNEGLKRVSYTLLIIWMFFVFRGLMITLDELYWYYQDTRSGGGYWYKVEMDFTEYFVSPILLFIFTSLIIKLLLWIYDGFLLSKKS
jgi:hypothetical protein